MTWLHERVEQLRARLPEDWSPNPEADCDGDLDPAGWIMQAALALGLPAWQALDPDLDLDEVLGPVD